MIIPSRRALAVALAAVAATVGTAIAIHYQRLDLALSHYDARGHLVVARRIFDSLTPGWQQIGAVWLPLPHLLNALPVQIDLFYRTGASAILISVVSFAVATAAVGWIVATLTESVTAAVAGALVFGLNPNVLYLQATPMTEPLLMALLLLSVALLIEWCRLMADLMVRKNQTASKADVQVYQHQLNRATDAPICHRQLKRLRIATGCAFALACLTRYEAWPVTIAALTGAIWVRWRAGATPAQSTEDVGRIAVYPALAGVSFLVFSRVVVGVWFVDDFFIPENPAQGHLYAALAEIAWGVRTLSGSAVLALAAFGVIILAIDAASTRLRANSLILLALIGSAAVPLVAFFDGHPYRIRYMIPLLAAEAVCAGIGAGRLKRAGFALSLVLAVAAVSELHPVDAAAPMVVEAQWDRPNIAGRAPVTAYLSEQYRGETIMASMGSLGHYMQDLSRHGFALRDFLHEGNGDIWLGALVEPRPFAGWMLIEEKAEGGDVLSHLARTNPNFLKGFSRVSEGAGLALYRREPSSADAAARR